MKAFFPTVCFLLGLIAGGWFFHSPSTPDKPNQVNLSELQEKIQNIHDVDMQEYLQLKDQKAQFLKANEILGKMMTIFLADLGLRVSSQDLKSLKEMPLGSEALASGTCEVPMKDSESAEEVVRSTKESFAPTGNQSTAPQSKPTNNWKQKEKSISNVTTDTEIENFLKDVVIEDFFSAIKGSGSVRRRDLNNLNGVFEGVLTYDSSSEQPAEVYMEMGGVFRRGQVRGSCKIILSRNGKPFNNSNSNGNIDNYKKSSPDSPAIFVDLGGRSGYFQLYFVRSNSVLVGNYYKQQGMDEFVKTGTVTLYKR